MSARVQAAIKRTAPVKAEKEGEEMETDSEAPAAAEAKEEKDDKDVKEVKEEVAPVKQLSESEAELQSRIDKLSSILSGELGWKMEK